MTKVLALRMTALATMWLIPACSGSDGDPGPVSDPGTSSSPETPAGSGLEVERFEIGDEGIRVSRLLVPETGKVVVGVPGQDQVRFLDPGDGSVEVVSVGPGGANFLSRMGWSDGTFWTTDLNHRELVRFSLEGDELTRTELDFRRQEGAARARGLLGILPGGRLVVDTHADGFGIAAHGSPIDPRFLPGSAIETLPVWTMEPDGSDPETLATLTTLTRFWLLEQIFPEGPRQRGVHVRNEPFEAYPLIAVSPSGNHIALVDRFPPDGEGPFEYVIHRLSPEGDTTTTERHGYDPVEIRDSWVQAAVQEAVQDLDHVSAPEEHLFLPSWLPPVSSIRVGDDGTLWIEREAVPESETRTWDVIDPAGNRITSVQLPESIRPQAVGSSEGWALDSTPGEEHVVLRMRVPS